MGASFSLGLIRYPGIVMHDAWCFCHCSLLLKGVDRSAAYLKAVGRNTKRVRTPGIAARQLNRIRIVYEQPYRCRYEPPNRGRIS